MVSILAQEEYCKKVILLMPLKKNIQNKKIQVRRSKNQGLHFMNKKKSKSNIKKVPSCLPSFPPCVQENNKQKEEDLNFMEEEYIYPNQQVDQEYHNYIEIWFETIINLEQHIVLQQFLISSQSKQ